MENNVTKRSKIPYFFFAFFAVVVVVNVAYIYISKKTWRGVVSEDAYQKGLDYNVTLEQVKKQTALGWQVNIDYKRKTPNLGILGVRVFDKNYAPIRDAVVYVNFRRPTQEGFDFAVGLESSNDGFYKKEITFPLLGQWEAGIIAEKGADRYQEVKRFVIQ